MIGVVLRSAVGQVVNVLVEFIGGVVRGLIGGVLRSAVGQDVMVLVEG